ncbi:TetR/AcrR family transcriptional regulator [Luteimicrobium subarcticum]|uniref:TetR family transcriptional regulator n=1 Tax=Luteimicrobium subarcticum TaxID=620910 RepID=A0A2M8WUY9_9MICO|nr:TetR/AcrR family transcriptional regulator [Luteimicrobium subarcticum]PJI94752.1 TetR family transcriptional regulator [Luteimicrobium subarcticum]
MADTLTAPRRRLPRASRRAQLLGIATELFAEHGYHHISMDDIADRAGVSKPVLYRHFPSKLDLYLAVVDACADHLVREVEEALAPARALEDVPGQTVVRAVVDAYATFALTSGRAASLLFESDVTRDDTVRARVMRPDVTIACSFADVLVHLSGMSRQQAEVLGRTFTGVARTAAAEIVRTLAEAADDELGRRAADEVADLLASFTWGGLRDLVVTADPPQTASA